MPDLERIQQRTPGTLSQQWYEDGAAVDPGTVTIGITRADGTVLVAAGAATSGATTAPRTYNLTTTHTALLDRLTVTWTSTLKGTLVSYVEVVGGFLFTISELRALNPQLADPAKYSTAAIVEMRTIVEDALEGELGYATVPRYAFDTRTGRAGQALRLRSPHVRAIRSVTVNGVVLSAGQLAGLSFDANGFVAGYWWGPTTTWFNNVIVGYEHGQDRPSGRIQRAAKLLAKIWLVSGPVDDRTNTFTSTEGGTFSLVTPGRGGSIFGVPEVDAAVQAERLALIA